MRLIVILIVISIILLYIISLFCYYHKLIVQDESYTDKIEWNDTISGCYYINLDRSTERREYMEEMLKKCQIPCTRFSAKEGRDYMELCDKLDISEGALGCKLSHLELLKKVKKDGWTIIFEDDIFIDCSRPVKEEIIKFLRELPNSAEFVLFGTSPRSLWYKFITFGFDHHSKNVWKTKNNLTCAHAYAINYSGAQKWISQIEKYLCKKAFDMHYKGIDTIYICHKAENTKDFFRLLGMKDLSYIRQNKDKFGYFDSLITEFRI